MGRENPLITLGVPKRVLVREQAFGTQEDVLKIAEANYRTLSKRYHPDLPGGDADLMAELGDAIDELRDKDALEFYIDELVGESDIEGLYQQQQQRKLMMRDNKALSRLAGGYAFVDQFEALGIAKPTSYIADLSGQRIIVDVLSPSKATARVTDLENGAENPTGHYDIEVAYRKGVWREAFLDHNQRKHWEPYTTLISTEQVKLIGFVSYPDVSSDGVVRDASVRATLDSSIRQATLDWDVPQNCWFLPELLFAKDEPKKVDGLVLYKEGRFAVTHVLLGTASMKTE